MNVKAEALMRVKQGELFGNVPNLGGSTSGSSIGNPSPIMGLLQEQTLVSDPGAMAAPPVMEARRGPHDSVSSA